MVFYFLFKMIEIYNETKRRKKTLIVIEEVCQKKKKIYVDARVVTAKPYYKLEASPVVLGRRTKKNLQVTLYKLATCTFRLIQWKTCRGAQKLLFRIEFCSLLFQRENLHISRNNVAQATQSCAYKSLKLWCHVKFWQIFSSEKCYCENDFWHLCTKRSKCFADIYDSCSQRQYSLNVVKTDSRRKKKKKLKRKYKTKTFV